MSRFTTFHDDPDLRSLVRRAHGLAPNTDSAAVDRVVDDLLRRNPHLRDLSKVKPGDLVELSSLPPELERIRPTPSAGTERPGGASPPTADPIDALAVRLDQAKSILAADRARRARGAVEATKATKASLKTLKTAKIKAMADTALLRDRFKQVEKEATERVASVESSRDTAKVMHDELAKEVVALAKAIQGRGV